MIEVLDEMLQFACPGIGVKIGTKCIHGKYYIDDLSIMTSMRTFRESLVLLSNFAKVKGLKLILVKQKCVCSTREEQTSLIFKYGISVNSSK